MKQLQPSNNSLVLTNSIDQPIYTLDQLLAVTVPQQINGEYDKIVTSQNSKTYTSPLTKMRRREMQTSKRFPMILTLDKIDMTEDVNWTSTRSDSSFFLNNKSDGVEILTTTNLH